MNGGHPVLLLAGEVIWLSDDDVAGSFAQRTVRKELPAGIPRRWSLRQAMRLNESMHDVRRSSPYRIFHYCRES